MQTSGAPINTVTSCLCVRDKKYYSVLPFTPYYARNTACIPCARDMDFCFVLDTKHIKTQTTEKAHKIQSTNTSNSGALHLSSPVTARNLLLLLASLLSQLRLLKLILLLLVLLGLEVVEGVNAGSDLAADDALDDAVGQAEGAAGDGTGALAASDAAGQVVGVVGDVLRLAVAGGSSLDVWGKLMLDCDCF